VPLQTPLSFLLYGAGVFALGLSLVGACHAILYKRDPRASVSWTGVILLVPVLGVLLYLLFGINRVQRRAARLKRKRPPPGPMADGIDCTKEALVGALGAEAVNLTPIARLGVGVVGKPLLGGNEVTPLVGGEEAYPEMIRGIDQARESISLLVYIFEKDSAGEPFIEALVRAAARGVTVRVLLDDVGSAGTLRETEHALAKPGISIARFQPLRLFRTRFMNLRNHRKILVVDGRVGFTGGMNIRQTHYLLLKQPHHEADVHFRFEGPVVAHLEAAFAEDWSFTTRETLLGEKWFPRLEPRGPVLARGIPGDPGGDQETLRWMIVGALACARTSVLIMTPYFLPDPALIAALNVAALRGVRVDILVPERNDNRLVEWACTSMLWQVLTGGCRVWLTPSPFEHTKLMVVDQAWSLVGSANMDWRSLRLNFEFDVECYDRALGEKLGKLIIQKRDRSREVTLQDVDRRPLGIRLRDGMARLFVPYL
jgi:cardiolipin synthase